MSLSERDVKRWGLPIIFLPHQFVRSFEQLGIIRNIPHPLHPKRLPDGSVSH